MKVLQINAVYKYSSTGRSTSEFHEYLKSQGIVSAIAAVDVPCENDEYIRIAGKLSTATHAILSRIVGRQGHFSYFSTWRLIKKVKKFAPDVIHLRVLHSNCINLPLLLKYFAKEDIPVVITLHDCWFFTGHCCYFVDSHCDRWKEKCGHCPDLRNWNKSLFFDFTTKNLLDKKALLGGIRRLAVIGVSDWVTGFVHESILKDASIIRRIYNWIDTEKMHPSDTSSFRQKINIKESDFVILACAQNWNKAKGIFDIIQIANRCPDYKFVLIGGIPQEYLPLPNNILTIGVLSDLNQLANYYSMADVFFNPSTRETFGKVTVEAMACGTPVVAYRLTATPELVRDGCGYVVDYQDFDAIEDCLAIMKKNGKGVYENNCVAFTHKEFGSEKLMNDYIELYKELIKC